MMVIYMHKGHANIKNFIRSENNFKGSIPFKVYKMESWFSGETYHSHEYMQIWYVYKGVVFHWINGTCHEMAKGDVFVVPPYVIHRISARDLDDVIIMGCEFSARFINSQFDDFEKYKDIFDFAYLQPFLVEDKNIKAKVTLTVDFQIQVENIMNNMLTEYKTQDNYYDHIIKAELLKLLSIIAREYGNSKSNKESKSVVEKYRNNVSKAIKYIDQNFYKDLKLDDACKQAMMSKSYFCYIFKIITQKTFTEYLVDMRIKKAMDLLVNTDLSITNISYNVGFNDSAYFCRVFKKMVGVSPKYYKKIMLDDNG